MCVCVSVRVCVHWNVKDYQRLKKHHIHISINLSIHLSIGVVVRHFIYYRSKPAVTGEITSPYQIGSFLLLVARVFHTHLHTPSNHG